MKPRSARLPVALAVLIWAMLVAVALATRPPMPVDETRYLAVAWEMWTGGDYLVPHLNGEPYHHKPPLLFWLINLGWALFGVGETWARLVAPLFGLGCILLTARLGGLLFPGQPDQGGLAALVLVGGGFFAVFTTLTFFDCLVAFFALAGGMCVLRAAHGPPGRGWLLYAVALGLGILGKGPVALLYTLPAALLAPLWLAHRPPSWARWYGGCGLAVMGGIAIALAWAVPAALAGGRDFAYMLFVGQTAQRVVEAEWHARPFWWYGPLALLFLYPWAWWPELARNLVGTGVWREAGVRFCAATLAPVFIVLSAISGKQAQYLLPLMPVAALLVARLLLAADEQGRFLDSQWRRLPPALAAGALGLALFAVALLPGPIVAAVPRLANVLPLPAAALLGGLAVVALAIALALDRARSPVARAATLSGLTLVLVGVAHLAVMPALRPGLDMAPVAAELARAEKENRPAAITYDYHGQYHFAGRLQRPLAHVIKDDVPAWALANPDGLIVDYRSEDPATYPARPPFIGRYRGRHVVLWPAAAVIAHGPMLLFDADDVPKELRSPPSAAAPADRGGAPPASAGSP